MDLHQLFVFTKVVENKSFSKAAEEVFLSQSTVSAHIQSLESKLNVKLFDRIGRENRLTSHGEKLYDWAIQLLALKDEALLDLHEGGPGISGTIRLAASSVPGQFIMPKIILEYKKEYENVMFCIEQSPSKVVADKVLEGTIDFGFLGERYESEKLLYVPLLKEKLMLVTSMDMEMPYPITIHDLIRYPFIMRNSDSGTNAILEKCLQEKKITKAQMNIVAYTDGQSLIQFVHEGIGIAIISEIAAKHYASHGLIQAHPIENFEDERFFYLVYNKERTQSLPAKLFLEKVRKVCKSGKGGFQ